MTEKHTNFVRAIDLPQKGEIEFKAWEKAKFINVEVKDFNGKSTTPILVLEDCPSRKQLTYRFLVLEGEAPLPIGERWIAMSFTWRTKRSFGTLFMSVDVDRNKKPTQARKKKQGEVLDERVGEEVEAFAP